MRADRTPELELELELKLEADPADLDRLARSGLLGQAPAVAREQVSIYYEGPAQELRAAGLSLRVRAVDTRYVQTIKAESRAGAGLFARPEWEREIADGRPVRAKGGPIAALIDKAAWGRIAPVFVARVTRRTIEIEHAGSTIEVTIDQGRIAAGERSAAINEVELELKQGSPASLFALARALGREAPLRLGVLTKPERGYRLLAERPDKAIKAEPVILDRKMTAAHAFHAITATCLRHFRLNEAILLQTRNGDALHQARVALRRLRSAVSIFKPMLADARLEHLRGALRRLSGTLGAPRDLDVLLERGGAAAAQIRPLRDQAYETVLAALASERARHLMLDLTEWAAVGEWRLHPSDPALRDRPVKSFAADTLGRLRRRMKRRGGGLAELSDEDRHEVRIDAKKLRYAGEFFASLYRGKKAVRRTKTFLTALQALQEKLGDLNDIATEPLVLARLGLDLPARAAPARAALLKEAAKAHAALSDAKRFWS